MYVIKEKIDNQENLHEVLLQQLQNCPSFFSGVSLSGL